MWKKRGIFIGKACHPMTLSLKSFYQDPTANILCAIAESLDKDMIELSTESKEALARVNAAAARQAIRLKR